LSYAVAIGLMTGLVLVAFPDPARAALGTVLSTVNIPQSAQCPAGDPATAIALVQGSKINPGFPTLPVLVATSCQTVNQGVLHFIDPATGNDMTTITTSVVPSAGWGALAVRANKGDLLGCANDSTGTTHSIYSIQYNGLASPPAVGLATKLVDVPANGAVVCDGLAWDQVTNTIYKTNKSLVGVNAFSITSITGFSVKNGIVVLPPVLPALSVPANCGDGGLTLAGGGLLLSCSGDSKIHFLSKLDGTEVTSPAPTAPAGAPNFDGVFTPFAAQPNTTDVACDPVTFATPTAIDPGHKDALWTRILSTLKAIQLPGGTCGFHDGPLVLAPGACLLRQGGVFVRDTVSGKPIQNLADLVSTAGDALLDCWKDGTVWASNPPADGLPGISFDGSGVRDFTLAPLCQDVTKPATCASTMHKDIFVEIDYMTNHLPDAAALANVVAAFAAAPVQNPDHSTGILLHLQVDEQLSIPDASNIALEPCTGPAGVGPAPGNVPDTDFATLKRSNFGTPAERAQGQNTIMAKRLAFHYAVWAHNLVGSTSSGCSQIGGSDLVVSLGSFTTTLVNNVFHPRGTTDQQAGTFMHELGHNLGFRHGGGDNVNCKPNYLSVMSYSRQFSNLITGRRLDYSHDQLPTLDEVVNGLPGLFEANGIGVNGVNLPVGHMFLPNEQTVFGNVSGKTAVATVVSIIPAGNPINWDLDKAGIDNSPKNIDINNISAAGCDGTGTQLVGFNDWANVHFNLRASLEFAGGADTESPAKTEPTSEDEAKGFAAVSSDGNTFDALNCANPFINPNPAGTQAATCLIDVKPGDPSNISNLVAPLQGVLPVALLGISQIFDPTTMVDVSTLTLDGHPVQLKPNGQFNCSTGDVSGPAGVPDGVKDLLCKFTGISFPSNGSFYVILEGNLLPKFGGAAIRARDVVNVCRPIAPATTC
jgi:hypothetical protein